MKEEINTLTTAILCGTFDNSWLSKEFVDELEAEGYELYPIYGTFGDITKYGWRKAFPRYMGYTPVHEVKLRVIAEQLRVGTKAIETAKKRLEERKGQQYYGGRIEPEDVTANTISTLRDMGYSITTILGNKDEVSEYFWKKSFDASIEDPITETEKLISEINNA